MKDDKCMNSGYYEQKPSEAEDRIAELEQDSKRLDWLEENIDCYHFFNRPSGGWSISTTDPAQNLQVLWEGDTFRQAIDKAMEADNG